MNQSIKPGQTRVFTRQWGSWLPGYVIRITAVGDDIQFTSSNFPGSAGHFSLYNNGELDRNTRDMGWPIFYKSI